MQSMTSKPDKAAMAAWLRKLDRASSGFEKSRTLLEDLIADARTAGVPLMTIASHTPYSREWARQIADRVDAARAAEAPVTTEALEPNPAELIAGLDRLRIERAVKHLRAVRKVWFGQAWQETAALTGEARERAIATMAVEAKLLTAKDLSAF